MKRVMLSIVFPIVLIAQNGISVEQQIARAADFVGVPSDLLTAICWVESGLEVTNLSESLDGPSPSYGICQVKLETALFMDNVFNHTIKATVQRLRDPYICAFYAAKYLKWQMNRYDNALMAVDAYNKGRYVSIESYYVKRVLQALNNQ